MNLNLLAFETSSSLCGVALLLRRAGVDTVTMLEHEGAQEHAERLLPMANQLLDQAGLRPVDLDGVGFGQGPGGFTGLRVACGVAQGISLALGIPVLPVVSHQAVAEATEALSGSIVLVALDARMAEVYLAAYRRVTTATGLTWEILQAPLLIAAEQVVPWACQHWPRWSPMDAASVAEPVLCAGDAWDVYAETMPLPFDWVRSTAVRPLAIHVAKLARSSYILGEGIAPESAAPLYVRDKVAFTTAERERGEGGNPRAGDALLGQAVSMPIASNEVVLQSMTLEDLPAIAALDARAQAFPWTQRNFADALAAGYDTCVLRAANEIVGFCVLMHAPDVSHVLAIAVDYAWRRQGLGRRLITWSTHRGVERGTDGLLLEVRPSNGGAIAFYAEQGFRHIGTRKDYYPTGQGQREDACMMQKNFTSQEAG